MASSGTPHDLHDDEILIASPVDGFFNSQPSPTVMVEDPSLKDTDADRSLHHSSRSSPRQRNEPFYEEERPSESSLLLPSAPPTYSAATAGSSGRTPPGSSCSDQGSPYSDTDYHVKGRPEIFPPHAELLDLGSSREPSMPKKDGWRRKLRKDFSRYDRRLGRPAVILMAVLLGIGFVTHACSSIVHVRLHIERVMF
ncbi:MAG: hypothetical protein Q9214_001516 [Letrouitia sp. 1 TL-2023]